MLHKILTNQIVDYSILTNRLVDYNIVLLMKYMSISQMHNSSIYLCKANAECFLFTNTNPMSVVSSWLTFTTLSTV